MRKVLFGMVAIIVIAACSTNAFAQVQRSRWKLSHDSATVSNFYSDGCALKYFYLNAYDQIVDNVLPKNSVDYVATYLIVDGEFRDCSGAVILDFSGSISLDPEDFIIAENMSAAIVRKSFSVTDQAGMPVALEIDVSLVSGNVSDRMFGDDRYHNWSRLYNNRTTAKYIYQPATVEGIIRVNGETLALSGFSYAQMGQQDQDTRFRIQLPPPPSP